MLLVGHQACKNFCSSNAQRFSEKNLWEAGFTYDEARWTAICQDNLGKLVPECLPSGFYWS